MPIDTCTYRFKVFLYFSESGEVQTEENKALISYSAIDLHEPTIEHLDLEQ